MKNNVLYLVLGIVLAIAGVLAGVATLSNGGKIMVTYFLAVACLCFFISSACFFYTYKKNKKSSKVDINTQG